MTVTTISNTSTTAQTILGDDQLFITSAGELRPFGPAVTWNMATPGANVFITNSGIIAPSTGRAIDTTGTAGGPARIALSNNYFATITAENNIIRLQQSLAGGSCYVDNAGTMTSTGDRGFDLQNYSNLASFTFVNRLGATLQSTDDAIRLTAPAETLFTGVFVLENSGTIKATGAGQALDLNDLKLDSQSTGRVFVVNRSSGVIESADADAIRAGQGTDIGNYGTIRSRNAQLTSTGNDAIDFQANSGSVGNSGLIEGARHGIAGSQPVQINNQPSGTITGLLGSGVNLATAPNTESRIINLGTIIGHAGGATDGDAVDIDGLGRVLNYSGGTITALGTSSAGLTEAVAIGGGTINNSGLIISSQRAITVDDSNLGGAFAAVSITNSGTITGANGEAIAITGTFGDTIINQSTGTINGGIVTGGGNDNIVTIGTINGTIQMGEGNDVFRYSGGSFGAVDMGSDDDNVFIDTIIAGSFEGGAGTDTLNFGQNGTAQFGNTVGSAVFTGFETVFGTLNGTSGNDVLDFSGFSAVSGNLSINGGDGVDILTGGSEIDFITGGSGNDLLNGGGGIDTAFYQTVLTTANITASGGGWLVDAGNDGTDFLLNIERIGSTRPGRTLLVGNGGFATIQAAIDAAEAMDTILIAGGIYVEQLTINSKFGLRIEAANGATVEVKAPDLLAVNGVSDHFGNNVARSSASSDRSRWS